MPEPSKINRTPFHRREEVKLLHLQMILDNPVVPPWTKELSTLKLIDDLDELREYQRFLNHT